MFTILWITLFWSFILLCFLGLNFITEHWKNKQKRWNMKEQSWMTNPLCICQSDILCLFCSIPRILCILYTLLRCSVRRNCIPGGALHEAAFKKPPFWKTRLSTQTTNWVVVDYFSASDTKTEFKRCSSSLAISGEICKIIPDILSPHHR